MARRVGGTPQAVTLGAGRPAPCNWLGLPRLESIQILPGLTLTFHPRAAHYADVYFSLSKEVSR